MTPEGPQIDDHAKHDQRCHEPLREPVRLRLQWQLADLQLLHEESETGDDKPKSHERQTGSNPGKKGSFGGEVDVCVAQGFFSHFPS